MLISNHRPVVLPGLRIAGSSFLAVGLIAVSASLLSAAEPASELSGAEIDQLRQTAAALAWHRQDLDKWIEVTSDPGPETPEVYDLETDDQMKSTRNEASREAYRKNAELYKRWAREGK